MTHVDTIKEKELGDGEHTEAHEETSAGPKGHEQIDHAELDVTTESSLAGHHFPAQTVVVAQPRQLLGTRQLKRCIVTGTVAVPAVGRYFVCGGDNRSIIRCMNQIKY